MTQTQGLDPTIKAGIESDLRNYRKWRARLQTVQVELDAIAEQVGSHKAEVSQRSRRASNPTLRAVLRREQLAREAKELELRCQRVRAALMAMTPEQRRLVGMYYIAGASRAEVEEALSISRAQFWRIRDAAFETYAYVAGLLKRTA